MILSNHQERKRFVKFAIVGIIGAVIDFGVFNLLTIVFSVQAVVASVFSFTAAVISNFIWNRLWTYPDSRSKTMLRQLVQFFVVNIVGLGIRTPSFAFIESYLIGFFDNLSKLSPYDRLMERIPNASTFLGHNVSLAIVVLVVMLWNFFANRYWTYSDVE